MHVFWVFTNLPIRDQIGRELLRLITLINLNKFLINATSLKSWSPLKLIQRRNFDGLSSEYVHFWSMQNKYYISNSYYICCSIYILSSAYIVLYMLQHIYPEFSIYIFSKIYMLQDIYPKLRIYIFSSIYILQHIYAEFSIYIFSRYISCSIYILSLGYIAPKYDQRGGLLLCFAVLALFLWYKTFLSNQKVSGSYKNSYRKLRMYTFKS